jgi:6-pyruvoyltetrahydropterin/6-carboxytetrahydropterin synthase
MRIEKYLGELAAAHRLMNHGGACELLHGHNWAVTVWVEAPLNDNGIAVDFLDFERLRLRLFEELDHGVWLNKADDLVRVLKDNRVHMKLLEVDGEPTAENMAIHILGQLKATFPQGTRHGVKITESTGCMAEVHT